MITPEQSAKLRTPFAPEQVGKLPRVTCALCRKSPTKVCSDHKKTSCKICENYMTEKHIHLDFVGHANATDRLLTVDPEWTWKPMAVDQNGLPVLDRNGGLWINLTVCGVTRPGYGDAQGKEGGDGVKEAIGDAIRNASMRFGVALDLWAKTPLDDPTDTPPIGSGQRANITISAEKVNPAVTTEPKKSIGGKFASGDPNDIRTRLRADCEEHGWDLKVVSARYKAQYKTDLKEETNARQMNLFWRNLASLPQEELVPRKLESVK